MVVASNRLPVVLERGRDGEVRATRGSGGLVSALLPVLSGGQRRALPRALEGMLRDEPGRWIGWLGHAEDDARIVGGGRALAAVERELGCRLQHVPLRRDEIADYYHGFANEILWPLFHDQLNRCRFEPRYWWAYQRVNHKFARAIAAASDVDDLIWIHDYHLMRVAAALREAGVRRRTAFFLHIPFPPPDLLVTLPWRAALLDGLLAHDLVGFQTPRDLEHFVAAVRRLGAELRSAGPAGVVTAIEALEPADPSAADDTAGRGLGRVRRVVRGGAGASTSTTLAALPISVDYEALVEAAGRPEVDATVARLRAAFDHRALLLGVDRLDYSKGIPERLAAYDRLLERHSELRGRVSLLQVVIPSRAEIPEYQALEREIQRRVGAILGKHWVPGWTPVEYAYRSLEPVELLGFYRTADVAVVTPLKDGMNLICKEYCAAQLEPRGVLVLSEHAGAAAQLGEHSVLVNPYDLEGAAAGLYRALTMPSAARAQRMRALRAGIAREDIFAWVADFLRLLPVALRSTGLAAWPHPSPPQPSWHVRGHAAGPGPTSTEGRGPEGANKAAVGS